jgi:hypothetical protein
LINSWVKSIENNTQVLKQWIELAEIMVHVLTEEKIGYLKIEKD